VKTVPLGELCDINVGRTPSRAEPAYWGAGHRWLSIADMNQGHVIAETKEQITDAGARAGRIVQPGTVVLSFKLSIGKVGITEVPLYTNEAIAALPVRDRGTLDPRYLMRSLQAQDLAGDANRAAMGATLNKKSLAQIPIPLPSLDEQLRMASILDQADGLRAKRRQVLAHLDSLTQAIYEEMFGDQSFDLLTAREVMPTMRNGVSPASAGALKFQVLTLSAITQGAFDFRAAKLGTFVTEPSAEKRVSRLDFLMCRGNGNKDLVGAGVYAAEDHPDLVFPDTVIAGRVDPERVRMPFLEAAWRRNSVRRQIEAVARTTNGTYKVNQKGLAAVTLPIPPLRMQDEFGHRIGGVRSARKAVECALALDDQLFSSLQRRAFAAN
jgi:type I restriction enzyme S subunit